MYFEYDVEKWMILEFEMDGKTFHKVFATWNTSPDSPSWRVNSGIKKVRQDNSYYYFDGYSGSCYRCNKADYGVVNSKCLEILNGFVEFGKTENINAKLTVLKDRENWEEYINPIHPEVIQNHIEEDISDEILPDLYAN